MTPAEQLFDLCVHIPFGPDVFAKFVNQNAALLDNRLGKSFAGRVNAFHIRIELGGFVPRIRPVGNGRQQVDFRQAQSNRQTQRSPLLNLLLRSQIGIEPFQRRRLRFPRIGGVNKEQKRVGRQRPLTAKIFRRNVGCYFTGIVKYRRQNLRSAQRVMICVLEHHRIRNSVTLRRRQKMTLVDKLVNRLLQIVSRRRWDDNHVFRLAGIPVVELPVKHRHPERLARLRNAQSRNAQLGQILVLRPVRKVAQSTRFRRQLVRTDSRPAVFVGRRNQLRIKLIFSAGSCVFVRRIERLNFAFRQAHWARVTVFRSLAHNAVEIREHAPRQQSQQRYP